MYTRQLKALSQLIEELSLQTRKNNKKNENALAFTVAGKTLAANVASAGGLFAFAATATATALRLKLLRSRAFNCFMLFLCCAFCFYTVCHKYSYVYFILRLFFLSFIFLAELYLARSETCFPAIPPPPFYLLLLVLVPTPP